MDSELSELRHVIKFMCRQNKRGSEILRDLRNVYGQDKIKKTFVYKWIGRFNSGQSSIADEPRSGRPTVITKQVTDQVLSLVLENRRVDYDTLCRVTGLSYGTMHVILHEKLQLRKRSARWVPHHLDTEHLERRLEICQSLIERYRRGGRRFLAKILTCDETWVYHYDPETKAQSKEWRFPAEPSPTKYKRERTTKKVMCITFWDSRGVILNHMVPHGHTVNARYYQTVLEKEVKPALFIKRPDRKPEQTLFLQDNASAHTAATTQVALRDLGWTVLPHPAYSPDLAPSDYYLFPKVKEHLKGQHFNNRAAIASSMYQWFLNKSEEWFTTGIMKLPERWAKCVAAKGAYFEH